MAGTDSTAPWAWWLYVGSSTIVAFLLGYRIALSVANRAGQQRRTTTVIAELELGD